MKDLKRSHALLKSSHEKLLEITKENNILLKESLQRNSAAPSVHFGMKLLPAETQDELENLVKQESIVSTIEHLIIYFLSIMNTYLKLYTFY